MKAWLAVLVAILLFSLPVTVFAESATAFEEQWEASGAGELWETLPEETKTKLETLGITEESLESGTALQPEIAWNWLLSLFGDELGGPLSLSFSVIGIILLCALIDSLRFLSDNPGIRATFQAIATLTVCGFLLTSLSEVLQRACAAVESCLVFLSSFVPVYATLLATSGQITTALSYQATVLWVSELLMLLMSGVVMPILLASLAIGTVGGVSPTWRLQQLGSGLCRTCSWGMGVISSFFTGLLSLQTIAGAAADTVTGRAIRFSIANLIPVVGGALSDAMLTIKGCLTAVRSTVGVFGIAVAAAILLPPILACIGWNLLLSLCGYVAEVFALDSVAGLTRSAGTVIKTMTALLVMCAVFLIVAISVLMRVGGTGA